jgi:V/A-type H+-transporting ATPase subunit D
MASILQVNPTRMELTTMKRRLVTARRGHKLLKDKRDEMVRQFLLRIRENHALRRQVEQELGRAFGAFALAGALMEPGSLRQALMYPARRAKIAITTQNILSVKVPKITVDEESLQASAIPYGLVETSSQLDQAIAAMAQALPQLIKLAEVEKTCSMLADEIQKTRRRVNALEHVMIPQFEDTIRFISMKLDENERGSLTRLMKVKEMIRDRT